MDLDEKLKVIGHPRYANPNFICHLACDFSDNILLRLSLAQPIIPEKIGAINNRNKSLLKLFKSVVRIGFGLHHNEIKIYASLTSYFQLVIFSAIQL